VFALCCVRHSLTHQASVLGWQPDSHLSYTPPSSSGSVCTLALILLYLTGQEGAVCCAEAVLQHKASTAPASTRKRQRPKNPAITDMIVLVSAFLLLPSCVCHQESLRATSCTVLHDRSWSYTSKPLLYT
jgi:hypothetical protein